MSTLLSPRKFREKNEVEVDLGNDQHVLARKEDMTVLLFDGRIPMPLLAAVQRMIDMPNATDIERMEALGTTNGNDLVAMLKNHAVSVVIRPRIVKEDTGNPDDLPVSYLTTPQLMAIWSATAVIPRFTAPAAGRFREGASVDDAPAPPDGENVSAAPEQLAPPATEVISG